MRDFALIQNYLDQFTSYLLFIININIIIIGLLIGTVISRPKYAPDTELVEKNGT